MSDRLRRVRVTPIYVIELDPHGIPTYLGPYTEYQAIQIEATLVCEHRRITLTRTIPEWATDPGGVS